MVAGKTSVATAFWPASVEKRSKTESGVKAGGDDEKLTLSATRGAYSGV